MGRRRLEHRGLDEIVTALGDAERGTTIRRWFVDRPIAAKLAMGLGLLGLLTSIAIAVGLIAGARATANIDLTTERRAPITLASSRAQADMLRMVGAVRGYLALGDQSMRDGYTEASKAFETDFADLERLAESGDSADPSIDDLRTSLNSLEVAYGQWRPLPEELFAIRDDQLRREPALRILIEDATPQISTILEALHDATRSIRDRPASARTQLVLEEFGDYEASFLSLVSGLRGYVTTSRDLFKFEYASNRTINETAWDALAARRPELASDQQAALDRVEAARTTFEPMAPEMFNLVEGDRSREDLFQFKTRAVGLADLMIGLLDDIASSERALLQSELTGGRDGLSQAQAIAVVVGVVVLLVGFLVAVAITRTIARPVERLSATAERIHGGDLDARAEIESKDEVGQLAGRFNAMTARLGDTIRVQQEYIREVGHVTDAAAAVEGETFEPDALTGVSARTDALGQLARTFVRMAREVRAREERLKAQVRELKIEIDEARQAKRVAEITDTDYFKDLRARASDLRRVVEGGEAPPDTSS
jgi:methyl-accepting chemotaxis protein